MKFPSASKIHKPSSSATRRRARTTAARARIEVGENSGTPFVVYPYAAAVQSNLELQRARSGVAAAGAQVSGSADPNELPIDTSGQAPAAKSTGEVADRVTQAMHLLTLEQTATATAALPTTAELETLQNPQAGLNEAVQTALGALHKIMIAREMLKSGGLAAPVYIDEGVMTDCNEGLKYGQTASGRAVDNAYRQALEGVESTMGQLAWVKQCLDDERSKVLATIVKHGHGF
ncbi:MAG: hypothetical protein LQ347_005359 [Umbilicaria vellea]|nr:MAG: hypothetical protein LQ347_005359 [Umbilicaria vellea]